MANESSSRRKQEHLRTVLNEDVGFKGVSTGLENYQFIHQALPEVDLDGVSVTAALFGKALNAPLIISSMVGGIDAARQLNRNLAQAAQAVGVAMGVGSQRVGIDDPGTAPTYKVRDVAPDILLFANLGAVQLNYGYGVDQCRRAVEMIGADALILHLNPLQEALQPGGNTNFSGLLGKIEKVCRELPVPVMVKEVGCGISERAARMLVEAGVAAIDVAGAGGTSWSEVERRRTHTEMDKNVAAAFASWGIATADSIVMVRRCAPGVTLVASGGISDGVDAAKAIGLGADAVGVAAPLLKAASVSAESAVLALQEIIKGMRISMFCIGAANLKELKGTPWLRKKERR
ncbi:MAG: type 2 isopentenyl-diphosphate Delta-isomerase [Chloroflexi bacterium]|nr:type 2 isopentenyl-diphosphate Delta-isomerase [Chloroflexota bacterium]